MPNKTNAELQDLRDVYLAKMRPKDEEGMFPLQRAHLERLVDDGYRFAWKQPGEDDAFRTMKY